jgi:hypothetical protein
LRKISCYVLRNSLLVLVFLIFYWSKENMNEKQKKKIISDREVKLSDWNFKNSIPIESMKAKWQKNKIKKTEVKWRKNCCASKIQQKIEYRKFPNLMRHIFLFCSFPTFQILRLCRRKWPNKAKCRIAQQNLLKRSPRAC